MGNLQVKNMPRDLHRRLRERSAKEGVSMRDYVLRLIERDLSKPTMAEWLDEISRRKPLGPGASGAELVAEARAEREAEIDAWLEELAKRRRTRSARD